MRETNAELPCEFPALARVFWEDLAEGGGGGVKNRFGGIQNRLGGDVFYERVLAGEISGFAASDDDDAVADRSAAAFEATLRRVEDHGQCAGTGAAQGAPAIEPPLALHEDLRDVRPTTTVRRPNFLPLEIPPQMPSTRSQ